MRRLHLLTALALCVGALVASGVPAAASVPRADSAALVRQLPAVLSQAEAVAHPATAAAVAKFLLHAGIAYYVFDHYIWQPFKAGHLHGFTHAFTIAKAVLAAAFVYHEVKLMAGDVKKSKLLTFLATPITLVVSKLESLKSAITGGNLNAISGAQSQLGSVKQQANGKGIAIKEIVHAL